MTKHKIAFITFGLLLALYAVIRIGLPLNPQILSQYGLGDFESRLLLMTIALPYVLIWSAAFYGFIKIREYAKTIQNSKEGAAFLTISYALMILAYGLPLVATIRVLMNYASISNPEFLSTATIAGNYFTLLVGLLSFTLLYQGARGLVKTIKKSPSLPHYFNFLLGFLVLSTTYAYMVLSNPLRHVPDNDNATKAIYYLPDWLLILTIILPYIYTWFLGFSAAMYIYVFQKEVKGLLYRRALFLLSLGLGLTIASSVLTQFITALQDIVLSFRLSGLLMVIYILLAVVGVGYILTAPGARRLKKIEDV